MTLLASEDLDRIRQQLPAVQRIAYLNAGSLGPLPRSTVEAMDAQDHYDMEHRQAPDHWDRLSALQRSARDAVAALSGVSRDQVALMHSTHEGLNACLWGLDLQPGENVITTDEEHPGLLVPLSHAQTRLGTDIRVAPWRTDEQAFVDAVLAHVDSRTRAVFLSHVSWKSGRPAPLRALRDALPAHVRVVADGAQSGGVLQLTPDDGWDAVTISGQKWPCGPNGSGGLALLDPEAWQPTFGAYSQLANWDDYISTAIVPDGRRFEMSQEALQPLAGFVESVRWLLEDVGLARAQAHAAALNERARTRLLAAGVLPESLHGEGHLLGIDVADGRATTVSAAIYERGYLIRPLGDDRLRCSFGCWNTPEEVEGCADAIAELLGGT